jgi:hypothetical protein
MRRYMVTEGRTDINAADADRKTALHFAAVRGRLEVRRPLAPLTHHGRPIQLPLATIIFETFLKRWSVGIKQALSAS